MVKTGLFNEQERPPLLREASANKRGFPLRCRSLTAPHATQKVRLKGPGGRRGRGVGAISRQGGGSEELEPFTRTPASSSRSRCARTTTASPSLSVDPASSLSSPMSHLGGRRVHASVRTGARSRTRARALPLLPSTLCLSLPHSLSLLSFSFRSLNSCKGHGTRGGSGPRGVDHDHGVRRLFRLLHVRQVRQQPRAHRLACLEAPLVHGARGPVGDVRVHPVPEWLYTLEPEPLCSLEPEPLCSLEPTPLCLLEPEPLCSLTRGWPAPDAKGPLAGASFDPCHGTHALLGARAPRPRGGGAYWMESRASASFAYIRRTRSKSVSPSPARSAASLMMVGASWQWSPARTSLRPLRIGIQQETSSAIAASSITTYGA